MKITRNIVEIDEERCNGCGQCVRGCAEGAISIVDGKAKVLADFLCDGLGACLAGCPQDALRIVEREADPFDAEAVIQHIQATYSTKGVSTPPHSANDKPHPHTQAAPSPAHRHAAGQTAATAFAPQQTLACGCSSSLARSYAAPAMPIDATQAGTTATTSPHSQQRHWPVKLRLVPPTAPFLRHADIIIAADCAATASPAFHHWAAGKVVLIACPKFEDPQAISSKVAAIVAHNAPKSLTVLRMEVPCCSGLVGMCEQAAAGTNLALTTVTMACNGEIG